VGLTEAAGITSDLLGGKGAGLAKLSRLGLAIPPAFILTTEAYRRWWDAGFRMDDDLRALVAERLDQLRSQAGASGLLTAEPFLISVRASPMVSMPGMLNSILNVGITHGWLDGQPDSFRWELFTEFVHTYLLASGAGSARAVAVSIRQADEESSASPREASRHAPVGETLLDQVTACIDAVFLSRMRKNVAEFVGQCLLDDQMPIAAIVQVMVYGNRSDESASGVLWSRDIQTGEGSCVGTYLVNAQGPQVVGSTNAREPRSLIEMKADWPEVYKELCRISDTLNSAFPHVQEVEFTVDDRHVWLLQTRNASLSPLASLRYACSKVDSGAWTPAQAAMPLSVF
jgi:pyruvate,orthophosphate dikinase